MSLLEEQLEEIRKRTAAAGVTPEMAQVAATQPEPVAQDSLLPVPQSPIEKMMERDGKLKTMGKMLLGGFTGMTPFLMPELIGGKARYQQELKDYAAQQERQRLQDQRAGWVTTLTDGVDDPDDPIARMEAIASGMSPDDLRYITGTEVDTGAFGDGTQVERMLSMYHNQDAPLEHRRIARDFLNKPYNVTTPDGTYTYEGLGLREIGDDGAFIDAVASQGGGATGKPPNFTSASSAGEREKETLVDLIGEAADIYDMDPSFLDAAVAETLPPFISAGLMSESGQQYEAYKASIKSVVGKIYSGAVLNETEIENVQRGYIPQPGDTDATIKLKKRRLEALMKAYNKDPENFDASAYYNGGGHSSSSRQSALDTYGGQNG